MQIRPSVARPASSPFANEKFIILNRKFDFLNKFVDIFKCADFISNVQATQWARTVGQAILGIFLGIGHTECHFIGFTCVKFTF